MTSKDQIQKAQTKFAEWVKKFEVYETLASDELVVTEELKPFIWTHFQNDDESFAAKGFTDANLVLRMTVVGYFISRIPFTESKDEFEVVDTELFLECLDCEAVGENENGDQCETCLGERGTYIEFSLHPGIESNGLSWLSNDDPELARHQLLISCLAYVSDVFGEAKLSVETRTFDQSTEEGKSAFLAASGIKNFSSFEAAEVFIQSAREIEGLEEDIDQIVNLNKYPSDLLALTSHLENPEGSISGGVNYTDYLFGSSSGKLTLANAEIFKQRIDDLEVDSEFWMVAQTIMKVIVDAAKCAHIWQMQEGSGEVLCSSCNRTTLVEGLEDEEEGGNTVDAESALTPQTGFATSEPSRPDLVDAYVQATDDEGKESALNALCAARDLAGLMHLSNLSAEHGNLPEAEYLARWAVDVAPFEQAPAASAFLIESILFSQRRYHEAAWVRFAMTAYQPFEDTYEELHLAIRRGCEASGLPDPEMGTLLERVNPFKATTDSETDETYRDYLIARFMYDYGIADERTKKAFDARAQGRYLPETLDFIDFWQMTYQFLSREVLASAVLYAAILINGGEKSPWLPGGYLNP